MKQPEMYGVNRNWDQQKTTLVHKKDECLLETRNT